MSEQLTSELFLEAAEQFLANPEGWSFRHDNSRDNGDIGFSFDKPVPGYEAGSYPATVFLAIYFRDFEPEHNTKDPDYNAGITRWHDELVCFAKAVECKIRLRDLDNRVARSNRELAKAGK